MYEIIYTKRAVKDISMLKRAELAEKAQSLIKLIRVEPFAQFPSYETLQGGLEGAYSRRLNLTHRLVYEVLESTKQIKIISMWSYYQF